MKKLSWLVAAVVVGGGLSTALWAASGESDRNTPAPMQDRQGGDRTRPFNRPDGQRLRQWWREGGGAGGGPATRPISEADWQEITQFMKQYSPKRWAKLTDLPEERQGRLKSFVADRYRMMQQMKQNDPAMFDLRLKRLPIEDEIFALGWDLNHKPDDADATRKKLREQVRMLIESRIDEHELRIKELKDRLEQEQKRLAEAKANKDSMIDASMAAIDNERWPAMGELVPPMPGEGRPPQQRPPQRDRDRELRNAAPVTPVPSSEQGR